MKNILINVMSWMLNVSVEKQHQHDGADEEHAHGDQPDGVLQQTAAPVQDVDLRAHGGKLVRRGAFKRRGKGADTVDTAAQAVAHGQKH